MSDIPKHMLIPVTVTGEGPAEGDDIHHHECWCGDPTCDVELSSLRASVNSPKPGAELPTSAVVPGGPQIAKALELLGLAQDSMLPARSREQYLVKSQSWALCAQRSMAAQLARWRDLVERDER